MTGHIRGGPEDATWAVGIRQTGGRSLANGKDPQDNCVGQGSDVAGGPCCGETPTADSAISDLVRTRDLMLSCSVVVSFSE